MSATPEPDLQIAARLLAEGRPGDAVDRLGALVAGAPVYAAAHVLLATALEADGRPSEALAAWGRAAALVPSSPLVHRERRRLLGAARPEPDAAPPAGADVPADATPPAEVDAPTGADEPVAEPLREPAGDILAEMVADIEAVEVDAAGDEPAGEEGAGGVERDLRPVDERFLRDDEDDLADGLDDVGQMEDEAGGNEDGTDEVDAGPAEEGVAPGALFDPSDIFDGIAAAPSGRATEGEPAAATSELDAAPPPTTAEADESPASDDLARTPGGAGRSEPEAEGPHEAAPPRPDALADELDALISRLGEAPPIRPDPAFSGPAVSFNDDGADEMASETLAKIYAAQRQFGRAADVYETLAGREPERADDLLRQADEMRQRR